MKRPTSEDACSGRLALVLVLVLVVSWGAALGCGGRSATWDAPATSASSFGLSSAVAVVDAPAHRVVALGVDGPGALTELSLPTGHDVVATAVGASGGALYILSAGHEASLGDAQPQEAPRLTIVDGTTTPATSRDISLGDVLSDPLDGLAVDPTEHWAIVYAAGSSTTSFVTNPNALVVVDLSKTAPKPPQAVVLHSFGGHPEKLVFAPELTLPTGKGHLLVSQSDQDLTLLSLDDATKPDITVRLADASALTRPHPAEIVFDDGDPTASDDARIGVRFDGQSSVMTLQLQPAAGPNGYAPAINVADVGGVPSALSFVRTDGGLRLAALVPDKAAAVLVDPATSTTSAVTLPAGYRSLSLVTAKVAQAGAAAPGPDVALLWNGTTAQAGVSFWELGRAAGLPFRSIETVGIAGVVTAVADVPGGKNGALKVLSTAATPGGPAGGDFFILDLDARTATPLLTSTSALTLSVAPSGDRVWAFEKGGYDLAATDLPSGRVHSLRVDEPAAALFEVASGAGGHALVVLHEGGGLDATVFDADEPSEAGRRIFGALLTEGSYDAQ